MSEIKEKKLKIYPEMVSLESTEIIANQMRKNIFKICLKDGSKGTGFFCKIPFINNKELKVLMTNNHFINNLGMEKLIISINNDKEIRELELNNRIKYINKEFDIAIIEIKEKDSINNYLELDENIMKKDSNLLYVNNSIYILQYTGGNKIGVSYGILQGIYEDKKYNFNHLCSTGEGSSGSPIINLRNNKVIGMHNETDSRNNFNIGLFLNYAIEDFLNSNYIIKNLNRGFNLNLKESDNLSKLDLSWKEISNLETLNEMKIDNLKELDLSNNKISNLDILAKANFENLEKLNLYNNQISDIKVFENVKFINLKKLYLYNNQISDIKVLEKVKFDKLEELNLRQNIISDIDIFDKVKFVNLNVLDLSNNKILDIKVLEKIKFEKLKKLDLSDNQISDIKVLEKAKFDNLEELDLSWNKI